MIDWFWKTFDELSLAQLYDLMALRQEVFVVEQNCVYQDADYLDQPSHHLLGYRDNQLVACLRLLPPGVVYEQVTIGRVITRAGVRGVGAGRTLMAMAIEQSARLYPGQGLKLSGQSYLRRFYESFGFTVEGEEYLEDGIPHLAMVRPA